MAGKEQKSPVPLAPARYGLTRSDAEAVANPDGSVTEHCKMNKRRKCLLYVFLFAVFQTGVILLFTFTVMRIRTPKFRVLSVSLESNSIVGLPTNGSLRVTMSAELGVKNSNFGRFKFERTTVYFFYNGAQVGEAVAAAGRANWRSTKRLKLAVDVNVANSAQLERDLTAGVVALSSRADMRGNVRLAMVFKKKRSTEMDCSMEILTGTQQLRNIVCV